MVPLKRVDCGSVFALLMFVVVCCLGKEKKHRGRVVEKDSTCCFCWKVIEKRYNVLLSHIASIFKTCQSYVCCCMLCLFQPYVCLVLEV